MRSDEATRLNEEGIAAFRRGEDDVSLELHLRARDVASAAGDDLNLCRSFSGECRVLLRKEDHDRLAIAVGEGAAIWKRLSPDEKLEVSHPIHMLAESARMQRDFDRARELYTESLETNRGLGLMDVVAIELNNFAFLEVMAGNFDRATELARESVVADGGEATPYTLLALGAAAAGRGETEAATQVLSAAAAILDEDGQVWDPADHSIFSDAVVRIRTDLVEERFDELWEQGKGLDVRSAFSIASG